MDFSQVEQTAIPEGIVKQISVNDTVIWSTTPNIFNKAKLSEYGYKGSVYDLDGVEAVKIYDNTNNGLNIRTGFAEGKQYKITVKAKYVSSHGFLRIIAYYSDGTFEHLISADLTDSWKTFTQDSNDKKTLTRLLFNNAENGKGWAYYLNIDDLTIIEV